MRSLRAVTILWFLGLEVGFKLTFIRAFGNSFAPGEDHGWVTRMFLEAWLPIGALWLAAVAAVTGRLDRLRRARAPATVAALYRLPGQLARWWCLNWCASVAIVAFRADRLESPASVLCLLFSVAMGSSVIAHALTVWLAETCLREVAHADLEARAVPHSLRWRLGSYSLGMCGAPMMYFASLAFSVQHHPMTASDLTAEIAFQGGATVAFALASAAFLALSIIGPVRRMATIMRTIASGDEYVPVDRMPPLQNTELGALAASTNQMLDRLEHSDRERLALQTTLEDKVAERTLRLREANDQIAREFDARVRMELELRQVQRLEAIGRLAAGIAHEINTPVQFVSDSLQFVREGVDELVGQLDRGAEADPADGPDLAYLREQLPLAIERALEGLGRVTTIIRSMRNHAHPDRTEMTPVDLNEAITSTLTIARNEYKYVAELETALEPLPPVSCYVGDFNQVIINLIVNAAHAISDVVGTSGRKGRLTVRTWRDGPDVAISVADTGGGIPERVREHIFEPFFTTKPVGKGTGQGLAIAHSVIVEKHRGSLTFDTVAGEGTTFLIRIPIAGANAQPDAA